MDPPEEYALRNVAAIGKILGHQCHRFDDLERSLPTLRLQAAEDAPPMFDQQMIKDQAKALAQVTQEFLITQQSIEALLGLLLHKKIFTIEEAMSGVPETMTDLEMAMIKSNLVSAMSMAARLEKVVEQARAKRVEAEQKVISGDKNA